MIAKEQLTIRLRQYITNQIAQISKDNPIIAFMKPLLTRALDKNFNKIDSYLSLIGDDEGNIDAENILSEMIESITHTNTFNINAPIIGNIEIGNSQIKVNIPFTDKRLVFNHQDLQILKQALIGEDCITNVNE